MSESTEHSSIDAIEPSNASMKLMAVMLAAVAVSVAAVLGLIRGSEALMLAVALPAATVLPGGRAVVHSEAHGGRR